MINSLQDLGAYLASFLVVLLVLLVLCEIVLRSFFDASTMIADEYSGYFYLAIIFLALGFTLKEEGHIRITIITTRLTNTKVKIIDIIASFLALIVLLFAIYRTALFAYDAYELDMLSEAVSQTPLYLTQIVMPIGLILFLLSVIAYLLRRISNDY
jgi:TRAP-type mannitol/chloroaromatic compound transport system permease small subunit